MRGYDKGYKIKINDEIVTLNRAQIQEIARYDDVCDLQEQILDKIYPGDYNDDIAFDLANCTVSLAGDNCISQSEAMHMALMDGFFPMVTGKCKSNADIITTNKNLIEQIATKSNVSAADAESICNSILSTVGQMKNESDLASIYVEILAKMIEDEFNYNANETEYGEPTIAIRLPKDRNLEITHEEEGLDEKNQYYSWRVNCSNEEFDNDDYHSTCGVIDTRTTDEFNIESITESIKWAIDVASKC